MVVVGERGRFGERGCLLEVVVFGVRAWTGADDAGNKEGDKEEKR